MDGDFGRKGDIFFRSKGWSVSGAATATTETRASRYPQPPWRRMRIIITREIKGPGKETAERTSWNVGNRVNNRKYNRGVYEERNRSLSLSLSLPFFFPYTPLPVPSLAQHSLVSTFVSPMQSYLPPPPPPPSARWISFFIERNEEERDQLIVKRDRLKNSKVCEISKKIVEKIGNQREREKLSCSRLRLANKRETGMRKKRVNGNTPPHFAAAIFPSRGFFAWRGGRSPCNHD